MPYNVLIINGPNLGRLGERQPEIYGHAGLNQLPEIIKTIMGESAQQIVIHSLYKNTKQKVFYIIDINMLGYTTKTSNNEHLFKRIDKNPFVILQKNEQNMFRLLKILII